MTEEIRTKIEQISVGKIPRGYVKQYKYIYPGSWRLYHLGEITKRASRKNKSSEKLPSYSINNQVGFIPQNKQFEEGSYTDLDKSDYKIVHKGEFAYNPARINVGSLGLLKDKKVVVVSSLYVCFSLLKGFDILYFENWFRTSDFNKEIFRNLEGSVREYLFYDNFSNIKLPVPPLPEQHMIAEILTQCDKVIALKKERIEEEKKRKKWLMRKLLYPNSNKKVEDIKASWKNRAVGSVTTSFSGGTPKSSSSIYYSANGIPFIRSGEIGAEKTELFLSKAGLENSSAKMVFKGDLLYALYGANSGECFISKMDGAINQAILCLRSSEVDIQFLFYLLFDNKERIISTYLQGGQGNLSGELVKKIVFSFPDKSIQKSVSQILLAEDKVICSLEKEQIVWQQKKKALMQLLLTGIVRVNT